QRSRRIQRANHRRGQRVGIERPPPLPVHQNLVWIDATGLETLERKDRVVVAFHAEGALSPSKDLDSGRSVGLYPDRRVTVVDIPHDWSEQEIARPAPS